MLWLNRLRLRIRSLVRRSKLEYDLEQEMCFHLAEEKAEYMNQGMTESEAELAARHSFGSAALITEQCRDQRRTGWLDDLARDARFAIRTLLRSPAFTCAAVVTLALGIGANIAFFSAAYGVLFRPLPYPEPGRLVEIDLGFGGIGPTITLRELSTLVGYAGYLPKVDVTAQLGGEAIRLQAANVTWNLAPVLGVKPALGRWFVAAEETAGHPRTVVVSNRLWRERLNADPRVLGRHILLNEEPHEIIGVMPASFTFPAAGVEAWTLIRIDPRNHGAMWGSLNLWPIGRLKPGVTPTAAHAELRGLVERIRPLFPWRMPDAWGRSSTLVPHSETLVKDARPKLLALAAASFLLLLIACGNVANLLLTQWLRRGREFALREALGAARGRLLRQIITENALLASLGGLAGAAAGWALMNVLPALLGDVPRLHDVAIAPKVTLLAAFAMLTTFALLSAVPLIRSQILRGRVASGVGNNLLPQSTRFSLSLASLQLAMATALLIGAGLMARTLWHLANVESGIHATRITTGILSAGPSRCGTPDRCWAFVQHLNTTLAGTPGVRTVNWSNAIPLTRHTSAMSVDIENHPREPGSPAFVLWHTTATPGYFSALGIPLRAGRLFSDGDTRTAAPVAIVSESTARRFWPNESPLGKTIRPVTGKVGRTVIGVVADVQHYSLDGFPSWVDGVQYVPFEQALPASPSNLVQLSMLVESAGASAPAFQRAIRQRFPDVVLSDLKSFGTVRDESISNRRSTAWLLSLLAFLGLLLGIVGVYGVLSQRAAQRTREMGIRIALGATAGAIARTVLREALFVAVAGSAAGVIGAAALGRFLRSLLFGIAESDPVSYIAGPAILIVTALLAAAAPAWRASSVDAASTLRSE